MQKIKNIYKLIIFEKYTTATILISLPTCIYLFLLNHQATQMHALWSYIMHSQIFQTSTYNITLQIYQNNILTQNCIIQYYSFKSNQCLSIPKNNSIHKNLFRGAQAIEYGPIFQKLCCFMYYHVFIQMPSYKFHIRWPPYPNIGQVRPCSKVHTPASQLHASFLIAWRSIAAAFFYTFFGAKGTSQGINIFIIILGSIITCFDAFGKIGSLHTAGSYTKLVFRITSLPSCISNIAFHVQCTGCTQDSLLYETILNTLIHTNIEYLLIRQAQNLIFVSNWLTTTSLATSATLPSTCCQQKKDSYFMQHQFTAENFDSRAIFYLNKRFA
eukprot:TRINITY_DN16454_c0_g3_i5.p1 TRINITY_DN16454_c0_g3~~TRINITY_DN16454_c0_g3_i5.p1  ORF type:complete len:341 (+),score=-38.94 TRINITY_DN16454_c0_g3_i5:41-1024(+)